MIVELNIYVKFDNRDFYDVMLLYNAIITKYNYAALVDMLLCVNRRVFKFELNSKILSRKMNKEDIVFYILDTYVDQCMPESYMNAFLL